MANPRPRLNAYQRGLLCQRVRQEHWHVTAAARAAGVSRQTAHKWIRRLERDPTAKAQSVDQLAVIDRAPPESRFGHPDAPAIIGDLVEQDFRIHEGILPCTTGWHDRRVGNHHKSMWEI